MQVNLKMNARIQELHAQAYLHALHNQIKAREDGIRESGTFNNNYREKFAELIVRECISQLNIPNVPGPISAGLNLGKVAIKEHFGIES